MEKQSLYKLCCLCIKVIPLIMTTTLLIHLILYYLGIRLRLSGFISGTGFLSCLLMFVVSKAFKMCWKNRMLIVYCFIVGSCMLMNRFELFGNYSSYVLVTLIITGFIALTIILFSKCSLKNF